MNYHKKKNYAGRWIVKLIEASLILALVFFALDSIHDAFTPRATLNLVTVEYSVEPQYVEPQAVEVQLDSEDYFYMALEHQMRGEYYDAIADYDRSLDQAPNLSASWLNRGVAHEQLGLFDQASKDFYNWFTREGAVGIVQDSLIDGDVIRVEMSEGVVQAFAFRARAGQTLTVGVKSVGSPVVDPIVLILDHNGYPIYADDDILNPDGSLISMNSLIANAELDANCSYAVLVTHAGGGSTGTIEISFDLSG
jgi:hypothetical protein